jgi:hypothetical protein
VRGTLRPGAANDSFSHHDGALQGIAGEVQRLLAELKIRTQHFRVSMERTNSIVEFGADVSKGEQETRLTRLHRDGVVIEVVPVSPHE